MPGLCLPGRAYTPRGRLLSLAEEQIGGSIRAERMEKKEKKPMRRRRKRGNIRSSPSRPTWPHVHLEGQFVTTCQSGRGSDRWHY